MKEASGTRAGATARARTYVESGAFEADLARRVAFKTESQLLPASLPELDATSRRRWRPRSCGSASPPASTTTRCTGQGPVLLATRIEDAKLPTVLGYGHGDVIRGLEDQWTKGKGPWVTARDGDRLYGRGTADNKGQHTINMAALEAVRRNAAGDSASTPSSSSRWARRQAPRAWPSWSPRTRRISRPTCWSLPTAHASSRSARP